MPGVTTGRPRGKTRFGTGTTTRASKPSSKPCKDCGSTTRIVSAPGPRCATCHRDRRKGVSEARRLTYVASQYNLSPQEYQALTDAFNGKCWTCRRNKGRQVDHDHTCCPGKTSCGKCVRGLLCGPCNKFFGHIRDDTETIGNFIQYLEAYRFQRQLMEK